jgi:hypothetical protein
MLEFNLNEILKSNKELVLGFKGGKYYAFSGAAQGEALSIEAAVERLLITLTQQEEPRKLNW